MAEQLEEMIRRLHAVAEAPGGDRRAAPRIRREGVITIHVPGPDGQALPLDVQFRDCSTSGIGITSDMPMDVGASFTISIRHPQRGLVPIPYEVVRCHQSSNAAYIVGARVVRP